MRAKHTKLGGQVQPLWNSFSYKFGDIRLTSLGSNAVTTFRKVEIEMKAADSARKLLNSDSLSIQTKNSSRTVPITVRPHPTKGFATGVITVPDLEDVDEDDILEELRDQGVQRVRRLQRKENGSTVPTDTLVLSFCHSPDFVSVTAMRHIATTLPARNRRCVITAVLV